MSAEDEARARRAAERARWPGGITRLDDVPEVEVLHLPPAELVGMVRELTLAAWAMAGRPIPDYERANMPGRITRADPR